MCGEVLIRVRLGEQKRQCRLAVVAGKGPSLLQTFRIQWRQINALVIPPTINSKFVTENKGNAVAETVEA